MPISCAASAGVWTSFVAITLSIMIQAVSYVYEIVKSQLEALAHFCACPDEGLRKNDLGQLKSL